MTSSLTIATISCSNTRFSATTARPRPDIERNSTAYEEEASDWTTEFRREFNSLPPGSYTFRVWGRDAFGNVSGPVEMPFAIKSPPWLTWWAILFYVLATLALVYIGVRWRLRTLAQRNVLLEAGDCPANYRASAHRGRAAHFSAACAEANHAEERLPGEHEPRAADAAQRRSRVCAAARSNRIARPAERQKLAIIRRSGEHLLGLINDVLSLSKIEAGRLELNEQPFSPNELLGAVEAMTRVRADAKDLHFDVRIGAGFPPVVRGDDGKLRQVSSTCSGTP